MKDRMRICCEVTDCEGLQKDKGTFSGAQADGAPTEEVPYISS